MAPGLQRKGDRGDGRCLVRAEGGRFSGEGPQLRPVMMNGGSSSVAMGRLVPSAARQHPPCGAGDRETLEAWRRRTLRILAELDVSEMVASGDGVAGGKAGPSTPQLLVRILMDLAHLVDTAARLAADRHRRGCVPPSIGSVPDDLAAEASTVVDDDIGQTGPGHAEVAWAPLHGGAVTILVAVLDCPCCDGGAYRRPPTPVGARRPWRRGPQPDRGPRWRRGGSRGGAARGGLCQPAARPSVRDRAAAHPGRPCRRVPGGAVTGADRPAHRRRDPGTRRCLWQHEHGSGPDRFAGPRRRDSRLGCPEGAGRERG